MNTKIPNPFSDCPIWGQNKPYATEADETINEHYTDYPDGIVRLTDVANPTLSFFPATSADNSPRPAVLICPGGGYSILAWKHEGLDIAQWLSSFGFSAFVLKYRCPDRRDAALADAARAMRYIRANAESFNIDPGKVGVMGFSAGAHLIARLSTFPAGIKPYADVDIIDNESFIPDFQMPVYPAFIDRENWGCDPDFEITEKTPPAFIIQAADDYWMKSSVAYYIALVQKKVQTELHIFPRGDHGYGIIRNGKPTEDWPLLAMRWLERDILKKKI